MLLLFALASNRGSHDVANTKYSVTNNGSDQTACTKILIWVFVVS